MEEKTILIVDDEILTRRALRSGIHFASLGIGTVLEAGSAKTARSLLRRYPVDLSLIDVEMPEESGIELLVWIRKELGSSMPCAFLTCHASFDYARDAIRLGVTDYCLKPIDYGKVENLILRMEKETEDQKILGYGEQWLHARVEEGQKFEKPQAAAERIPEEALEYIDAHLFEKLSLHQLAEQAGVNLNYFNRLFKEKTGETVNQYVIRRKMEKAAELLAGSDTPSYRIAELLGYENYANFVNMFKKTYGMSPNAYRDADPGSQGTRPQEV